MPDAAAGAAAHEPSGRRPGALANIALFAALVVLAGVVLVPLIATALGGFKSLGDLQSHPFSLPRVWVWKNYWDILTGYRYWQVLGNSLLISVFTVALTLALSSMAAFTFAHLQVLRRSLSPRAICSSGSCFRWRRPFRRSSSRCATSAFSTPIGG